MMTREDSATMWQQLSYTVANNGGRSNAVTRVERMENDGLVVEYTVQEEIEQVVREETQQCFTLAAASPLCNGLLGEQLGNLADTEVAQSILFVVPDGVSDATVLVLEEIARIAGIVRKGSVCLVLSPAEYVKYWKAVNKRTSSLRYKTHFGHYKVSAMSEHSSKFFARKLTFIGCSGWAPSRWG
jgi:hypothetical protein